MMGCLFGCFRAAAGGGDGRFVSPSLAPTSRKDGGGSRTRPPSRNALSAVFLREDEGSRLEQTACSWTSESAQRKRMDPELEHETIIQKSCGTSLETTNEIQRMTENVDSVHQRATHSGCLPAMSDNEHFMEGLKVEDCERPLTFHQSSTVPDAMSSSKASDEMQTPATSNATDLEGLTNENNSEACAQNEYQVMDPVKDYGKCGESRIDFCQPDQSDEDPKCTKNDNLISMEISLSGECSLFQSSEGSVSSFNKIRDSTNTASMEKSLTTEATIHATRKKVLKNSDSDLELPSLAQWLKPPNPKKPFSDVTLTGDRTASSDEDRPIIGMVAAHWKDKEPENFTPKWWDGNGIPNSTNKYKEDQKVSWHAMPFEERLEKALSEEKLLSESAIIGTAPVGRHLSF
ncbi:protein JASON-like isoform X2 [Phragmites australis]|uniref:protein JASON-like isoform X2 n=1 Tax=Phragmites australis TaxID=29695 RepID=UPI002D79EB67|nr:protein JASON-like isoform X2 [Phragmites australis]